MPYGHFGDGCVHVRIDFPLDERRRRPGSARSSPTPRRAGGSHGGSLSGEHGDGRARSELLPLMYSAEALAVRRGQGVFDPDNLLNPGVLVDPAPVDADLRLAAAGRTGADLRCG